MATPSFYVYNFNSTFLRFAGFIFRDECDGRLQTFFITIFIVLLTGTLVNKFSLTNVTNTSLFGLLFCAICRKSYTYNQGEGRRGFDISIRKVQHTARSFKKTFFPRIHFLQIVTVASECLHYESISKAGTTFIGE